MVRSAIPGGVLTADQWLALDRLADVADGTIGLTRIAPTVRSEGPMFSARLRAEKDRKAATQT